MNANTRTRRHRLSFFFFFFFDFLILSPIFFSFIVVYSLWPVLFFTSQIHSACMLHNSYNFSFIRTHINAYANSLLFSLRSFTQEQDQAAAKYCIVAWWVMCSSPPVVSSLQPLSCVSGLLLRTKIGVFDGRTPMDKDAKKPRSRCPWRHRRT